MAKRNRNNSKKGRVISVNSNRRLPLSRSPLAVSDFKPMTRQLDLFEDRRTFHPEGKSAPARSTNRSRHRLQSPPVKEAAFSHQDSLNYPSAHSVQPHAIAAFTAPKKVLVCVRRKIRKEVMHALGKSGRSGQRRPRRSEYSSIQC